MVICWTEMLFSGWGSGLCDAAAASTVTVPVRLALTVMLNLAEAPLAIEATVQA